MIIFQRVWPFLNVLWHFLIKKQWRSSVKNHSSKSCHFKDIKPLGEVMCHVWGKSVKPKNFGLIVRYPPAIISGMHHSHYIITNPNHACIVRRESPSKNSINLCQVWFPPPKWLPVKWRPFSAPSDAKSRPFGKSICKAQRPTDVEPLLEELSNATGTFKGQWNQLGWNLLLGGSSHDRRKWRKQPMA